MHPVNIFNTIFICGTPSVLTYKSQLVSYASILFRLIYIGTLYTFIMTYTIFVYTIFEYSFT